MQFNNTTTKDGVIQWCEYYTGLGSTIISGDTTKLSEFTAYANGASRDIWHIIHNASGNWKYDDGNETDLPQATASLVNAQAKYALPSDALTVERLEYKDQNGNWFPLKPITQKEIGVAVDEFLDADGNPIYYTLVDRTIELFPAPDYSQATSLKVYYARGSVAFTTSDTTATPGFDSEYHDYVPMEASLKWLRINLPADARTTLLEGKTQEKRETIKQFYGRRFANKHARINRRPVSYR